MILQGLIIISRIQIWRQKIGAHCCNRNFKFFNTYPFKGAIITDLFKYFIKFRPDNFNQQFKVL